MIKIYKGTFVQCPASGKLEILPDHIVVVDERGFIAHIGPANSEESQTYLSSGDAKLHVISSGSFYLPTFCDLHLHAPQYLYQGTGLHLPLMEWLNEYAYKSEERLDADPALAKRVYTRLAQRLIENGTGATLLFGTIKEETNLVLAEAMQQAGVRAFVGKLSMDISSRPTYVESSVSASLDAATSFVSRCRSIVANLPSDERLIEPVVTPRFVPTCSHELLEGLSKVAIENDVRIQSHLAEARDQVDYVKKDRGVDDIVVFDKAGLLTSHTIQAHCTFLSPTSFSTLLARGTAIAHCPLSNAYFSSQPFRLREALDAGLKLGLGTDVAGGYSLDIMSAMRWAVGVSRMREGVRIEAKSAPDATGHGVGGDAASSRSVDWKETLYMATRGGAIALGLAEGSGTFTVGTPFDAQCIMLWDNETGHGIGALDFFDDGYKVDSQNALTPAVLEKWWCLGDSRNRNGVWVQGKELGTGSPQRSQSQMHGR